MRRGGGVIKHLVHSQGNTPLTCSFSSSYQYASKQTGTRYVFTMAFGDQSIVASLTPLRSSTGGGIESNMHQSKSNLTSMFRFTSFECHSNCRNISINTVAACFTQVKFNVSIQCIIVIQCTSSVYVTSYISWSSMCTFYIQDKFDIYNSF